MMTLVGASLSLAGLTGCDIVRRPVEEIVPFVVTPEDTVPGIPKYYATTMPFGRSAYGLIVESHEGRPTKIEGNPSHPATLGASSTRIQASVLSLYDPDRSQALTLKGEKKLWSDFVTAWGELSKTHAADGGAGLAIIAGSFSSPTLARLAAELNTRFPKSQWATYDAVSEENRLTGLRQAAGRDVDRMFRFDQASVVLCLDADPLLTDGDAIRHARGFADLRRAGATGGTMNRLYAVEAVYSLTGTMADHRLRLESRRIGAFVAALAARLGVPGATAGTLQGVDGRWLDALAKDLLANRGKGLIIAGDRQPAAVHAAVAAINSHLGNTGSTVRYYETRDAVLPSASSLGSLVAAMKAGTVQTLVVLGGNPVFDAPADLDFAGALAKVPHSIALTHANDETASKAEWHVPLAHYLESWGDARAVGGPLSVIQPMILPLFGGKSAIELLGLMIADKDRPGYDIVRDTWRSILGEADFDRKWNRVLHDGLSAGSELPEVALAAKGDVFADLGREPAANDLEIVFTASPHVHDGRFANNGWLQELPDPVTKLTWDNPALVSPTTARTLDIESGDMVRLEYAGRSIEIAVSIVPGMADGVVAVTLGYGRQRAGRIGNGVGFDTYTVRTTRASGFDSGATLTKLGRTYPLSATQDHGSMEGRPLVRESTVAELRSKAAAKPGEAAHEGEAAHAPASGAKPGRLGVFAEKTEHFSLWEEHSYDRGYQWGMTIDLNACTGCNACVTACQSENNIPVVGKVEVARQREMHWLRVDRYFAGEPEGSPEVVFQPIPCMHCEDAPCEQVCPVAATVHDAEGLNVMVYNRCIGTRYCSNNCPYKVRHFNFFNFTKDTPDIVKLGMNPDVTVRARGVMEKCTYCTQRINRAKIDAKLAGRALKDGDVKTACQQACPAAAIEFGDIRDAESRVAKAKADARNYALLDELNTKPRTTYLSKLRNPNPDLDPSASSGSSRAKSRDEAVS
jgi:molybdopterin-containing oxidoreductase family iron-sulfur binding subunit